jgi:hypothetical protein
MDLQDIHHRLTAQTRDREDFLAHLDILSVEVLEQLADPETAKRMIAILYDFSIPNVIRSAYRNSFDLVMMICLDRCGMAPTQFSTDTFEASTQGLVEDCFDIVDRWEEHVERYRGIRAGLDAIVKEGERRGYPYYPFREGGVATGAPVRFHGPKTGKPVSEVLPSEIPPGLDAEDVAGR